jgi:alpha-L-rhamnosidase
MRYLQLLAYLLLLPTGHLLYAARSGSQPTKAVDAETLRRGFAQPPDSAKLRCYWWWLNGNTTEETITHDLTEMKAKGYGGAILVDANGSNQDGGESVPAGPTFGSPAWVKLYIHALKIAAQFHLEISLNITSGWNLGGPEVKPEDASKILTWSRTTIEGGTHFHATLPSPPTQNGFYRQIAVLAYPLRHGTALAGTRASGRKSIRALAFKAASRETGFSMPDSTSLLEDHSSLTGEEDMKIAEVRDISALIGSDSVLNWQAPAGEWEILRIGYTNSGARVSMSSDSWQGLAIDHLDQRAFDAYWRHTVEPLLLVSKPYIGVSLRYLVTDSWELGGTNWTGNFREAFRSLRGYDPVPWLPVVAGRILQDRDASNRFLSDMRRTVADLIVTEHYDVFARHAAAWGLAIHPESGGPHGAPIDALETFRSSAFPQTEYWAESKQHRTQDDERFFTKEAASAAHIYGKSLVAQEGMTSIGPQWSESLAANLKPSFDRALTEGMNRLIWHEFTSSPASFGLPGQEYFAGTHLNPNVTWWQQADAFFKYLNRCQYLLQQGKPVADLLYFYGDQVPGFVRLKADDPANVLPGYDYDVTDEDALLHTISIDEGLLQSPGNIRYRALAVPASGHMSLAALKRIAAYVRAGGTVIGMEPSSPTGLISASDALAFRQLADAMWDKCRNPSHAYESGRVFCSSDAQSVLTQLHISPDFQQSGDTPELDFIHRRAEGADIYFVRNGSGQFVQTVLTFRTIKKEPELWDPLTGEITPQLIYVQDASEGTTRMPLRLPPYGSTFVVFARQATSQVTTITHDGIALDPWQPADTQLPLITRCAETLCLQAEEAGDYQVELSSGHRLEAVIPAAEPARTLEGPWTLTFQPGRGAPLNPVTISTPTDWSRSSDPAIRYFSGTARYISGFTLPTFSSSQVFNLQLTGLHEISTVRINGEEVGTIWAAPYQLDITRCLHTGDNHIEVKVTNLWPNRMIGDLQPGVKTRYTNSNIRTYTRNSQLLPSGLDGPVKLQPVYRIPLHELTK